MKSKLIELYSRALASRFGRNAFWSLIGAVFMRGLGLLTTVLFVRFLGVKVFGQFVALQGSLGLFGTFAGLGMGITITKHVAELKDRNPERAGRIVALCFLFSIGSTLLICLGLWGAADFFCTHTFKSADLLTPFRIAVFALLANALNGLLDSTFQGMEKYKQLSALTSVYGIVYILMGGIGAYCFGLLGAIGALAGCRLFIAIIKSAFLIRTKVPFKVRGMFSEFRVLRDYSVPSLASILVTGPVDWLPSIVFAGVPGGYTALGIFGAFNQIRNFILFLPDAIGRTNIPLLADAFGHSDKALFHRQLKRAVFINACLSLIIALPFMLLNKVIAHVYNIDYPRTGLLVFIITITGVVISINNALGYGYICSGKVWKDFRIRGLSFAFYLVALVSSFFCSVDYIIAIALLHLGYQLVYGFGLKLSLKGHLIGGGVSEKK